MPKLEKVYPGEPQAPPVAMKPSRCFIQAPFSNVTRHVVSAERTHPKFRAIDGNRAVVIEIRVERFSRRNAPGHVGGPFITYRPSIARGILPLKDGWQLLASKRCVSSDFVAR